MKGSCKGEGIRSDLYFGTCKGTFLPDLGEFLEAKVCVCLPDFEFSFVVLFLCGLEGKALDVSGEEEHSREALVRFSLMIAALGLTTGTFRCLLELTALRIAVPPP